METEKRTFSFHEGILGGRTKERLHGQGFEEGLHVEFGLEGRRAIVYVKS